MKAATLEKYIVTIVCSVFDGYSTVLFLPEEDGPEYYLAASFSLGNNIPADITISPGKGLVGWILQNRKPLIASGFDHSQNRLGYYGSTSESEIKAFMGYPIPTGGAICVDSKHKYSFTDKDYKLLQLFADLIAKQQSITHHAPVGAIPRYFAELGVIQDLRFRYKSWPQFLKNFISSMSDATRFDYCAFASRAENSDFYTIESESTPLLLTNELPLQIPVSNGITGWVFLHEQAVFAEEGGLAPASALFGKLEDISDFPAAICIPVFVNKSCRGVICLAHTEARKIDENVRNFIRQAVDHLSLFLENLSLRDRLRAFLPRTTIERNGSRIYNPDTAPMPKTSEDDILE